MSRKMQAQRNNPTHERARAGPRGQATEALPPTKPSLTDTSSLRWLRTQTQLFSRQARWLAELAELTHIPGTTNTLSRLYPIFYDPAPIHVETYTW